MELWSDVPRKPGNEVGEGESVNKYLDFATAIFALAAAVFWFRASGKLPPMLTYWDAVPASDPYRQAVEHSAWLNSVAAVLSGCGRGSFQKVADWACGAERGHHALVISYCCS